MSEPYVYPGFSKFADAAAEEHGAEGAMRGKIRMGWHAKTIASSLARLPEQAKTHPESVAEVMGRIQEIRNGLAAQLAAVDLAIDEVFDAIGDRPRTVLKNEPKPKRTRRTKAKPESEPEPTDEEGDQERDDEPEGGESAD